MTSINLKNIAILTSIVMVACGISANFLVYQSLSQGADSVVFSIIGVSFDILKLIIIIFCGVLWSRGHALMSLIAGLFWLCLTAISSFSAFGFTSASIQAVEEKKAAASEQVNRKREQLDQTTQQINALASVAALNIPVLKMEHATLEQQLIAARTKLSKCPPKYFVNCQDPANAKIDSLTTQIRPLSAKIGQHERYSGLLEYKKVLDTEYNTLLNGGGAVAAVSPIFSIPANVLKIDAVKIKFYFLSISALILELGSSFLVLVITTVFNSHKRAQNGNIYDSHATASNAPINTPMGTPMQEQQNIKKPFTSNTLQHTEGAQFNAVLDWNTGIKQTTKRTPKQERKIKGKAQDTGTQGANAARYKRIKNAVLNERVKPTLNGVKTAAQCANETAQNYLAAMHKEGLLSRSDKGLYTLIN